MAFRRKRSEQAEFVSNKLNFLFNTFRRPSGEEYSLEDVGRATGFHPSYIGRMRDGQVANPGRDVLEGLSNFFRVDPAFWFRAENDLSDLVESDPSAVSVVHRQIDQADLTPEQAEFFARMVAHVIAAAKQLPTRSENQDPSSNESSNQG